MHGRLQLRVAAFAGEAADNEQEMRKTYCEHERNNARNRIRLLAWRGLVHHRALFLMHWAL